MFVNNESDALTEIATFCTNDQSYIIQVRNSLEHTITLRCEEEPAISVTIQNAVQYALRVAPSSDLILNNKIASKAIEISMIEGNFPSSVELCFPRPNNTESTENACLAFWDDSKSPPRWRCQDKCLKKKNKNLCGKTDHFTNFAILLAGLPPEECDDSGEYVTGSLKGDMLLIWLFIGFFVLLWVVLYFLCFFPKVRVCFVGDETYRIQTLRE